MYQLGILGGMGPEAGALFLQRVIENPRADADRDHIPAVLLNDTAVPDRTAALLGTGPSPLPALQAGIDTLASLGVTVIASPCNTAHAFFDKLTLPAGVTLLNMVKETLAAARGTRQLCVLGTDGLCRARVYEAQADKTTEFTPLLPEEQAAVMRAINLVKAGAHEPARALLLGTVQSVRRRADPLFLLACTELSVLHCREALPFDLLDALEVLAQKTVLACKNAK